MFSKSTAMRSFKTILAALTIPLLAGCVAEQRLAWSPDGSKLAVVGSDGVHISTDGGSHLSEPVEEDATLVSWFPDSKRVLVVSKSGFTTWADIEKNVDKSEGDAIKTTAAQLLKQLEVCGGNFKACRDALLKQNFNADYLTQALMYLQATEDAKMHSLIGREWRGYKLSDPFTAVSTINIYDVDGKGILRNKQKIACTTDTFESAKVSPSSDFVFLVDNGQKLCLASTGANAKGLRVIARNVFKFPDWDFNTDTIYGIRSYSHKAGTRDVYHTDLFSLDASKPGPVKRLAGINSKNAKVRATVDGNLIYGSNISVRAPKSKSQKVIQTLNSFNLTSGKSRRVYQAVSDDALDCFDVSPDGKRISVTGVKGGLKVVDIKTGKVRILSSNKLDAEADIFAPVWKNNDEICFENVSKTNGYAALFSLKTNAIKNISNTWPMETMTGIGSMQSEKKISFERMLEDLKEGKK